MRIALNKVHFPITTLGYGCRVGIWTQGCSIRCKGCVSRDTWEVRSGNWIEISELIGKISAWLREADGVTISGGDPFDQAQALEALLDGIRKVHAGDILVYSGHAHQELFAGHRDILGKVDVLISEPYRARTGQTLVLRGSDNQRVFLLTTLARSCYPADIDQRPWQSRRKLDVMMEKDAVWMAGIPKPGEMKRLKQRLAERGYTCATSDECQPVIRA